MNIIPFTNLFHRFQKPNPLPPHQQVTLHPPGLERLSSFSRPQLPPFVQRCPVAMKYLTLLSPLDWGHLPWRPTPGPHPGPYPTSPVPYIAAYLVKLDQKQPSMGHLRQFLVDHPALTWVLGFPLQQDTNALHGFDVNLSLPMAAHFSYVLRTRNVSIEMRHQN